MKPKSPQFLSVLSLLAGLVLLGACQQPQQARIVLGHDIDGNPARVVDTTHEFHVNDVMMIQYYHESAFGETSLKLVVRWDDAKGKIVSTRDLDVDPLSDNVIIKGSQRKPLTARKVARSDRAGTYVVQFVAKDVILLSRSFEMFRGKEKDK